MDNKIIAKRISALAEEITADSDYVYDPKHLNRPHGGGTWYKTEKGWSTHKPLKNPHKKVKEVQKEDSNKPLNFLSDFSKIVSNPKASPETLHEALSFLEDMESYDSYHQVLQNDNVSSKDVDWVADKYMSHDADIEDRDMMQYLQENAMAVINHPNVSPDTLNKLTGAHDQEVANEAKRALKTKTFGIPKETENKTSVPPESKEPLDFTDEQYQNDYGYTPEQKELAKKAISSNVQDRADVASDENAPLGILNHLSQDKEWTVRAGVANNPITHPAILDELSNDDDWMVKWCVAGNPNAEDDTLDRMAKTGDFKIKKTVAGNTGASISTLDFLGESDDKDIVQNVVRNPMTSSDTLNKIKDRDSFWKDQVDSILEKRKTSSSELKQQADAGDDISKEWLEKRKKLRHDFCAGQLGDEETYQQMKSYKKSIGEKRGYGRSPQQVKDDFVRNMDPSKYGSPEEFQAAKKRIQDMPIGKFDKLLGIIFNKDEEDDEEEEIEE